MKSFLFSPFAAFLLFSTFVVTWFLYGILPEECGSNIAYCPFNGPAARWVSRVANFKAQEFGPFEALMGALAFAGLVLTLIMQQHELRLARKQSEAQTEIFYQQRFETSFYQSIDQFRTFHADFNTKVDTTTQMLAQFYGIGALQASKQRPIDLGSGIEVLNGVARAVLQAYLVYNWDNEELTDLPHDPVPTSSIEIGKHSHLRGQSKEALMTTLEKMEQENSGSLAAHFDDIGKIVIWLGGSLYPLVKRVRGILKILYAEAPSKRLQYIDFLQVELKPAELAIIAICALEEAPYGRSTDRDSPSFRELVKGSGLLNDFPIVMAELFRSLLTQHQWVTLVDECGLRVATARSANQSR
ncbi:hypothetical protein [Neptunicoccus sediminis]|uniref:hypothetical protein n=1 Tax=Neptunicoccus sediminis TaxID=1892596 RepID=UPI0012FF72F2|nr:hypothetical protein [Neptunicoccus sediminis]